MSYDWLCLEADLAGKARPARHVLFTATGNGADCWSTYPADIARAVSPDIQAGNDERWWWQPVAYGAAGLNGVPGWIPGAFPMQPSIDNGFQEWKRLLLQHHPGQTWGHIAYSEGSIVASDILDACGITSGGTVDPELAPYKDSWIGGVHFGGPRRQKGHTVPGGIDPGGHGIVRPQLQGSPTALWEFAAGKNQPGSPGQDLYTTSGYDGDQWTEDDEWAVWEIVRTAKISGVKPLFQQIMELLGNPVHGVPSAALAILDTLQFFIIHGLTPHTSYHLISPIPGDPRTCWDLALDYIRQIGNDHEPSDGRNYVPAPTPVPVPTPAPVPVTPTPTPVPVTPSNGSDNTVTNIMTLIKELPIIIKVLVQFLTVAGTVVGTISTILPSTPGGATAAIAGISGIIASVVRLVTHQPQPAATK